jgi:hypothetical protein
MYITITLDGKTYKGAKINSDCKIEAEKFYKTWDTAVKFQMILKGGSILLVGKDAIQRAVAIFYP